MLLLPFLIVWTSRFHTTLPFPSCESVHVYVSHRSCMGKVILSLTWWICNELFWYQGTISAQETSVNLVMPSGFCICVESLILLQIEIFVWLKFMDILCMQIQNFGCQIYSFGVGRCRTAFLLSLVSSLETKYILNSLQKKETCMETWNRKQAFVIAILLHYIFICMLVILVLNITMSSLV